MSSESPSNSDIVAAILYLTGEQFLISDPHRLHRALSVARSVCPLLNRFGFPAIGGHPTSRQLGEALGRLKLSRLVRMENTDYERYLMDEGARHYIESVILPRFTPEQRDSLTAAAAVLRQACGQAVQRA